LGLLTARAIEGKAKGIGSVVDPLFPIAVVKDLPGDVLRSGHELTHLFGRHAALQFREGWNRILSVLIHKVGNADAEESRKDHKDKKQQYK
jgi:hypothetical protein